MPTAPPSLEYNRVDSPIHMAAEQSILFLVRRSPLEFWPSELYTSGVRACLSVDLHFYLGCGQVIKLCCKGSGLPVKPCFQRSFSYPCRFCNC